MVTTNDFKRIPSSSMGDMLKRPTDCIRWYLAVAAYRNLFSMYLTDTDLSFMDTDVF